jgi:phospholipid/cholesterol/gamma-HCH transport system permease protein
MSASVPLGSPAASRRKPRGGRLMRALRRESRFVLFAAATLIAAFSPATYSRAVRQATAQAVCFSAWQALPGYALLSVLAGAVLTHIVAVSAATYGLSHLALEAVVRVYVVELLPLVAALFVALRSGLDLLDRLAAERARGADFGTAALFRQQVVPGVVGNLLAVIVLTLASGLLVLATAYLVVYGVTPWGLADYTRLVGRVFDPVTAPTLLLKIFLFGGAVAVAPVAVVLDTPRRAASGSEMRVMARLLLLLVAIEGATLVLLHF